MTLVPKDMISVYKATIAKGTNAMRWQRAAYVDLLPPCNNACPAGLNIQAWLSLAQAGRHEKAWRKAPSAAGHRVVHGGPEYDSPVPINEHWDLPRWMACRWAPAWGSWTLALFSV